MAIGGIMALAGFARLYFPVCMRSKARGRANKVDRATNLDIGRTINAIQVCCLADDEKGAVM